MLRNRLLHPEILSVLGRAGHSSQILIADGNYPFSTKLGPRAQLVNLNVTRGLVSCTQMLDLLASTIPIEAAAVMDYPSTGPFALGKDPEIWDDFRRILNLSGFQGELERIPRFDFYSAAGGPDVCLTIATGEERIFANLLLTIGVVR